jgi:hypothetical protein
LLANMGDGKQKPGCVGSQESFTITYSTTSARALINPGFLGFTCDADAGGIILAQNRQASILVHRQGLITHRILATRSQSADRGASH